MAEQARRIGPDRLRVPMRAESPGVIGDGMVEIGPEHPMYEVWAAQLDGRPMQPGPAPTPPTLPAGLQAQ